MACNHAAAADPRLVGSCVKCGRRRLPDTGPARTFTPDLAQDYYPPKDPSRDLALEHHFLTDAVEMAHRLTGISNHAYPFRVNHRLDVGRQRYGDGDYLSKDNLVEVLEETPDLAAYAMLELQRLNRMGNRDDLADIRLDLVAVAAYGAVADWYAQRAARRVRGQEA